MDPIHPYLSETLPVGTRVRLGVSSGAADAEWHGLMATVVPVGAARPTDAVFRIDGATRPDGHSGSAVFSWPRECFDVVDDVPPSLAPQEVRAWLAS